MTLQIPNDLYPNSQFLEKASIIAEYYMHIATIFGKYFSSEEEIISYLQSFKNHEDAEHFLETGNTLFLNRKLDDPSLQMVMIISAVEKNTQKGFSDFNSWVNSSGSTFDGIPSIDGGMKKLNLKKNHKSYFISIRFFLQGQNPPSNISF